MVSLLSLVEAAEGLVNGIDLSIEDLLIGAQVEAMASPPIRGLPDACCPNSSTVEAGTVCLDHVLSGPGPPIRPTGDLQCFGPTGASNGVCVFSSCTCYPATCGSKGHGRFLSNGGGLLQNDHVPLVPSPSTQPQNPTNLA